MPAKPPVIGVSYDDPETTPPEQIRYDCCIEVDENFQADEHVKVQKLQGGEFAIFTLKGPYGQITGAFRKIFEWIEVFYNRIRRHSTFGYVSPVDFEEGKAYANKCVH